ncbi:Hypothetical predicted protein [Pelobates cultripes]|uniref:Uncharacterized protein n=1 Tax=Pelobates cultripes TaxID=61616 RepID=A0AAD1WCD0_PELCU|nr:Hypothetical predicted protein [Pelobates cultripes]
MEAYYTREKGRPPIPLPSGSDTFAGSIRAQQNLPPLPVREIPAPTSRAVGSGGMSDQRQEGEDNSCKMVVQSTSDKRRQLPDLQLRLDQLFEKFWHQLESRAHLPASQLPSSHLPKKQPQQGRRNPKVLTANRTSKWRQTKRRFLPQHKKTNTQMKYRQEHKAQLEKKNTQTYLATPGSRGLQRPAPLQPWIQHVSQPLLSPYGHGDPHAACTQHQLLCRSGVG